MVYYSHTNTVTYLNYRLRSSNFLPLGQFETQKTLAMIRNVLSSQVVLTRSEPAGSFMFLHVPCNRIPAGFSTDKFRRISCRFRLECPGTGRNSSVEKPAGIRLQGTWRNIKDPSGSGRFRQGSDRFLRSEWSTWDTNGMHWSCRWMHSISSWLNEEATKKPTRLPHS